MGKTKSSRFLGFFDQILFILAGNEDIHKSLYEFEFRTNPTTDYGISCPWVSKKSMSSRNLLILIRSFSNLLVTRTCIILWMSSNFGQIGPPTTELAALERLINTPIDLIMRKMVFPLFLCFFLIGSFWYFHVTRTSIKAWMSLNFLKWDLTLAHWPQMSDRCPLGYLFLSLQVGATLSLWH